MFRLLMLIIVVAIVAFLVIYSWPSVSQFLMSKR